jgi:hypothetical protein
VGAPVSDRRSILVITSCTGLKTIGAGEASLPAERLYAGEQHRRLMRGVDYFRASPSEHELDLRILSAGHGVVTGAHRLGHYDASFAALNKAEIDRRAAALGVPGQIEQLLSRPYALTLLLLGDDYMRAAAIGDEVELASPTIAFCGERLGSRLEAMPSLKVVPAGKQQTRRFACGLVGLKGELGGRLLRLLADDPDLVPRVSDPGLDLLNTLDAASAQPLGVAA